MIYFVQPHNTLGLNAHHQKIQYDEHMDPYLYILGACWEVEIEDVDISSTSRRDDGDARGRLLSLMIAYLGILLFFVIL
jgi:hypothetical protein